MVVLVVYLFEEFGIGLNKYNFDDVVCYCIYVFMGVDVVCGFLIFIYDF